MLFVPTRNNAEILNGLRDRLEEQFGCKWWAKPPAYPVLVHESCVPMLITYDDAIEILQNFG